VAAPGRAHGAGFLRARHRGAATQRYADGVSGDWYVRGLRGGRYGLLLGPFDDETRAAARIGDVRGKLRELADTGEIKAWLAGDDVALDTHRLEPSANAPLGQMNRSGFLALQ